MCSWVSIGISAKEVTSESAEVIQLRSFSLSNGSREVKVKAILSSNSMYPITFMSDWIGGIPENTNWIPSSAPRFDPTT